MERVTTNTLGARKSLMEMVNRSGPVNHCSPWLSSCIVFFSFSLLVFLLYGSTASAILTLWRTSTFSHGFLIVPICIYLVWKRRDQLRLLKPTPAFWAVPVLILLALGWLLGHLAAINVAQQFCFVAMILVNAWGVFGTDVARAMLMPLTFGLFAVPFGEAFVPKLQDFSAWSAVGMLDFFGIPVLLEGRFITVPSGKWEVAEACSGIRFVTASLAVGFLFAGLLYKTWTRRVAFFAASVVVPILANAVRVFGIILLAYLSGNRIAVGVDHILYGWLFFTIVMGLLLLVGGWWGEKPERKSESTAAPTAVSQETGASTASLQSSGGPTILFACMAFFIVGLAPASARFVWGSASQSMPFQLLAPVATRPFQSSDTGSFGWKPKFLAPNAELTQFYQTGMQPVELYVAYYASEQPDVKLVSSANALFDRSLWWRTKEDEVSVSVEGRRFQVRETFIRSPLRSLVVWTWYWVDGQYTSSDRVAKLLLVKARLLRDQRGAAIFAIATPDQPDVPAIGVLRDFLDHVSLRETMRLRATAAHPN